MGSYNISCGLTGLTINCNDPCVAVPLTHNSHHSYTPCDLPVFGIYNDYGRVNNLEVTSHACFLKQAWDAIASCNAELEIQYLNTINYRNKIKKIHECNQFTKMLSSKNKLTDNEQLTLIQSLKDLLNIDLNKFYSTEEYPCCDIIIKYQHDLSDQQIRYLCELEAMKQAMFNTHRPWLPTVNGPQFGDPKTEFLVNKITSNILNQRKRKQN